MTRICLGPTHLQNKAQGFQYAQFGYKYLDGIYQASFNAFVIRSSHVWISALKFIEKNSKFLKSNYRDFFKFEIAQFFPCKPCS